MENVANQIIDEGIIKAESGLKYRYRCFLSMPLGMGIIYPIDKNPETLMLEIELEEGKHNTVHWQNTGQILPVYKFEDGTIEMPLVLMSIYGAIYSETIHVVFVEEDYEKDHEQLYTIWSKNWSQHVTKSDSMSSNI